MFFFDCSFLNKTKEFFLIQRLFHHNIFDCKLIIRLAKFYDKKYMKKLTQLPRKKIPVYAKIASAYATLQTGLKITCLLGNSRDKHG